MSLFNRIDNSPNHISKPVAKDGTNHCTSCFVVNAFIQICGQVSKNGISLHYCIAHGYTSDNKSAIYIEIWVNLVIQHTDLQSHQSSRLLEHSAPWKF